MTDKQLIHRIQKDDKRGFDELFERYYDQCYAFASALVKDVTVTKDILQNVFLKIWIGRMKINPSRPFKNYLFISIRNESITYLRNISRLNKTDLSDEFEDLGNDIVSKLLSDEVEMIVSQAVEKMPPQRREIFKKNRVEGKSVGEIAAEMGLSPRTVERHLYLARKDLQREISEIY